MDPFSSERRVIEAAEALARTLGADPNHTVAAAALDSRGRIHTAVTVYHFTGGPCPLCQPWGRRDCARWSSPRYGCSRRPSARTDPPVRSLSTGDARPAS